MGDLDRDRLGPIPRGPCWGPDDCPCGAGLDGHPPVSDIAFFDHRPVVCSLSR